MKTSGTSHNSVYKVSLRFAQITPLGRNFLYPRNVIINSKLSGRSGKIINKKCYYNVIVNLVTYLFLITYSNNIK